MFLVPKSDGSTQPIFNLNIGRFYIYISEPVCANGNVKLYKRLSNTGLPSGKRLVMQDLSVAGLLSSQDKPQTVLKTKLQRRTARDDLSPIWIKHCSQSISESYELDRTEPSRKGKNCYHRSFLR